MLAVQQEQQPAKVVYLSDTPPAHVEMLAGYPDLLTPAHVAKLTGLCAHTVRDLCRRGELPAVKIAARWYVPKSKFLEFLEGGQ